MTEYNIFILDCITDVQKVKDTIFREYMTGNICKEDYNVVKKHCDRVLAVLKHL